MPGSHDWVGQVPNGAARTGSYRAGTGACSSAWVAPASKGVDEVVATVGRDGSSRATAVLRPGVYELFCPLGGHEQAGMTAKLTVR